MSMLLVVNTRKNNVWNRRLCEVLNNSSNYLKPDKQWRPSVEAAECSEALIRRQGGGNNGIIVLDLATSPVATC